VPEARVLVPLRISVRTMIGTSVIEASRIVVDSSERAPRPQRRAQVE
jgi:translation initiation factor 2 gamma subunit (eIF-2gamma)